MKNALEKHQQFVSNQPSSSVAIDDSKLSNAMFKRLITNYTNEALMAITLQLNQAGSATDRFGEKNEITKMTSAVVQNLTSD